MVAKFGTEFGFATENCQKSYDFTGECNYDCFKQEDVIKVKDFGYVGKGFYGGTNEREIMKEIYQHGPVVVAFNASPDLYYYSSGVFLTNPKNSLS